MSAVVDAYGNINLKTNLVNAGTSANGSAVIVNQTASQIKFKRIKAGAGITITETDDSIIIAVT